LYNYPFSYPPIVGQQYLSRVALKYVGGNISSAKSLRHAAPQQFRNVEAFVPVRVRGEKDASAGTKEAFPERAFADGVVALVLIKLSATRRSRDNFRRIKRGFRRPKGMHLTDE
jgi:hypothetical protein